MLWCAALPAVLGIAMAVVATIAGCDRSPPSESSKQLLHLRCVYRDASQTTCTFAGRTFSCARGDSAWRCTEVVAGGQR